MKNAKVRSFLAQEFKDLKARLSKKKFNDQKPKWITGLATIKDALKNFKDARQGTAIKTVKHGKFDIYVTVDENGSYGFILRHGYNTVAVKNNLGSEQNAIDVAKSTANSFGNLYDAIPTIDDSFPDGSAAASFCKEAIKKAKKSGKSGADLEKEAFNILYREYPSINLTKAMQYISQHINDSSINDEIVKRINWRGYHIWIQKWGNKYSFSVYSGACGRGNPFAHDDGFESVDEAYNAAVESAREHISYYGDSAEYINDRKIDIKKDGELIDTVNAESLDEAVRIYERQHPELRGQIDAYFSDKKVEDNEKDPVKLYRWLKENNIPKAVWLHHFIMSGIDKMTAKALISRYESGKIDTSIKDSLSEKAKRLIETAVREARYDYRVAIGFAEDDLKAEKEWSWSNQNEVKEYIRRLINNQLDR